MTCQIFVVWYPRATSGQKIVSHNELQKLLENTVPKGFFPLVHFNLNAASHYFFMQFNCLFFCPTAAFRPVLTAFNMNF